MHRLATVIGKAVLYRLSLYEQGLLKSHENTENEIRLYSTEIERLKELSRKVNDGYTTSTPHYVSYSLNSKQYNL